VTQVQGGDYSQEALDVGTGVLTERVKDRLWVIGEVIEFAQNFQAKKLRATVAAFNQRHFAWKKVGFTLSVNLSDLQITSDLRS